MHIRCLKDHAFFKYPKIVKADAGKKENYEALSEALKEYFQKLKCDMSYGSAEFQHCKQANNQSVVDYYNKLNMHARRAYPSVSQKVFKHLLLEKF